MFEDAAALYVGLGWEVFPLAAGSKLPAIKGGHGFKDATDDADQIRQWAKAFPNANIAIATGKPSGIVVVDIDPRNGGADSVSRLAGRGFLFPDCPQAKTGNNGRHLFFALPSAGLRPSKDRLGRGIDIKSTGGYVVAAPSWIAPSEQGKGGRYEWVRSPQEVAPPPVPQWVLKAVQPKRVALPTFEPRVSAEGAQRKLEGMAKRLATAGEGERNNILNWSSFQAGVLVRQGRIGSSLVSSRLTQAALAAGLTLTEVQATIASAMRGAFEKGGSQ